MKVSIIIASYNVQDYIKRCIESLIIQSLEDIQIIIVNDGSTDNTEQVIKSISDSRILYLYKDNGGLSDARNYGLKYALGDYIAFVDGDDYVVNNMYELMYESAIKNDSDLVECSYYMDYPNKTIIKNVKHLKNREIKFTPYNAWNKLIKRDLIRNNGLEFKKGLWYEDFNFNLKLAKHVSKVSYVDAPLYHYIQRDNSIMHTVSPKVLDIYDVIKDVINDYEDLDKYNSDLEYIISKELLISTLKRLSLYDKENSTNFCKSNYNFLKTLFPNWRKNKYLKQKSLVNTLMKSVNRFTYDQFKLLLRFA